MIKSLLPFKFSRDKRTLIPNSHIFGEEADSMKFPEFLDEEKKVPENIVERELIYFDNLQYIKLDKGYDTTFWRYQNNGKACLATIEAAYYCFKEIASNIPDKCIFI